MKSNIKSFLLRGKCLWQKLKRILFSVHAVLIHTVFPGIYLKSRITNEAFYTFLLYFGLQLRFCPLVLLFVGKNCFRT
jgi:hypothetical protein